MPRKKQFNSSWEESGRKTAKNKKRCGGGRFTKTYAMNCNKVCALPIQKTGVRFGVRLHAEIRADINPCSMNVATWLDQFHLDDYRCYFCHSDLSCNFDTRTNYTLCSKCSSSSDPTSGWWGPHPQQQAACTNGVTVDVSSGGEDIFHPEGSAVRDTLTGDDVLARLMVNGSRMKTAKRYRGLVSVNNQRALLKDESKAVQLHVEVQRVAQSQQKKKRQDLQAAAKNIPMQKITGFFSPQFQDNCLSSSASEPLRTTTTAEDSIDVILDEALRGYYTEMNARVDDMLLQPAVEVKSVRERLWDFKESQMRLGDAKGIIMGNAYIKFEEYLREGNGDGKGAFSELKAGRIIAMTVFPRGKQTRKNVSKNRVNQKYWYRYRARAIITGYRYLVATGCLMPEQRGKCKGTSLIHDPHVRHFCFDIIGQLGSTWSARTFRDKISAKMYSVGMLKEGTKIGRSTATYYLRELGMLNRTLSNHIL